jgi:hypothetical protein
MKVGSYPWQLFQAIKDRVTYMESREIMRTRNTAQFLAGNDEIMFELVVVIGDTKYTAQEVVTGTMHDDGYWVYSESAIWQRVCREMVVALHPTGLLDDVPVPSWALSVVVVP